MRLFNLVTKKQPIRSQDLQTIRKEWGSLAFLCTVSVSRYQCDFGVDQYRLGSDRFSVAAARSLCVKSDSEYISNQQLNLCPLTLCVCDDWIITSEITCYSVCSCTSEQLTCCYQGNFSHTTTTLNLPVTRPNVPVFALRCKESRGSRQPQQSCGPNSHHGITEKVSKLLNITNLTLTCTYVKWMKTT
jgi:hypothetical protein